MELKSAYIGNENIALFDVKNGIKRIFGINNNGVVTMSDKLGIGTGFPDYSLDVKGTSYSHNVLIGNVYSGGTHSLFHARTVENATDMPILFLLENVDRKIFQIDNSGLVHAREIKVDLSASWPDYVFTPSYKLMPLEQVEAFINTFKHLPNVPDAKTVETEGVNLGEMSKLSFEKIEELTLYAIEQKKMIEALKLLIEEHNKRIETLESKTKN